MQVIRLIRVTEIVSSQCNSMRNGVHDRIIKANLVEMIFDSNDGEFKPYVSYIVLFFGNVLYGNSPIEGKKVLWQLVGLEVV